MQKKIAVINDLSGYGRCSLTVAIPVLSAMGHQCCPVPTAILSNHTEFPVYFFDDYTEKMTPYTDKWKELGLSFDAIATGFLGSEAQIEIVMDIIQKLDAEKTFVVVDPVMGDHGHAYETYTPEMCEQMKELVCMAASDAMEYEQAIEYRELLNSVKQVAQKQKITSHSMEDRDVIAMARDDADAVVQVFFVRDGKMIGREHFRVSASTADNNYQIIGSFVKQFYAGTPFIPREIWVQEKFPAMDLIAEWLTKRRGQAVKFLIPKKGQKERLVELAEKNAKLVLDQDKDKIKREELRTIGAMNQVGDWLGLEKVRRMEAYDISNISGFESVGSMVVFEDGRPKRNDYRKFKIKTVQGPNDYASMEEVLTRRFTHGMEELEEERKNQEDGAEAPDGSFGSFTRFPDLILMDGGRGQVNIALSVLSELKLNIPVCGMVKDDNHRTRGLYYNNVEIPIDRHSEGFKLVTRIQDEAHRFAIEYHRSLRSKAQVHSVLDDIEGIGPARRKALMRRFKSLEAVRDATLEELESTEGMNKRAAESVYAYFRGKDRAPEITE